LLGRQRAGFKTLCAVYPGMGIAAISSQIGFFCRAAIKVLIYMGFLISSQTGALAS